MKIFNLFTKNKQEDPYWEFDESRHFRPKLNKADFFRLTGFDFGWFVLQPISSFMKDKDREIENARSLTYIQKALHYWWYVDGQVTNGGFVQFYYNGLGPYMPTVIKSLKHIKDNKMADLLQRAETIYQKNKALMDKARTKDLFGSDLYERLDELTKLDQEYYKLKDQTMSQIEDYIRKNPAEFGIDEDGNEINTKFTGDCRSYHPNTQIREEFSLENGIITGEFKSYYEDGTLKEKVQYLEGKKSGERTEFFQNGNLKYTVKKDALLNHFRHQWYFENGNPQKLEHKHIDKDENTGEYKEWFDNGQLNKTGTYVSNYIREGEWLEYYQDGSKNLEAEYRNGILLPSNHWNKKGEQTLQNGTGLYVRDHLSSNDVSRDEEEYKNYVKHGLHKSFRNGVLTLSQEMENGLSHGLSRTYYKNGKTKEESLYNNGKRVSSQIYPKSDRPTGSVTFRYLMKEEWLEKRGLPTADSYPSCLNEDEIKQIIKTPKLLFEPQYHDVEGSTCLWLSVDENGDVTNSEFTSAYMTNGEEFLEVADRMKFKPGIKEGKNVASFIYIIANFTIE